MYKYCRVNELNMRYAKETGDQPCTKMIIDWARSLLVYYWYFLPVTEDFLMLSFPVVWISCHSLLEIVKPPLNDLYRNIGLAWTRHHLLLCNSKRGSVITKVFQHFRCKLAKGVHIWRGCTADRRLLHDLIQWFDR